MSGEDFCREVSIVGGTYRETCYCPFWNELFGSGWRSVWVYRAFCPDVTITYHTVGGVEVAEILKVFSGVDKLKYQLTKAVSTIGFYYNHPLACPLIQGCKDERFMLNVRGRCVIGFGMMEAQTQIEGEWVVYDPQSPRHPLSFRAQGGKAGHLALVLNESEAKKLSGETELPNIKNTLFDREGCECLVVKCGAKGAIVFSSKEDDGEMVPVFKTSHVWPIGSGDVFTTVFSFFWFSGLNPVDAARNASKAVAAYCEKSGEIETIPDVLKNEGAFNQLVLPKKGLVYLAGPFFTLREKLFVSECRNLLQAMGAKVFSPYHDVGEGKAEDVAPKDIEKLNECACVFAIVDGLDSGTLFEVGYAVARGKRVVAYVENETEGALKMLKGTGCDIEEDFTTAIYKTYWYAAE